MLSGNYARLFNVCSFYAYFILLPAVVGIGVSVVAKSGHDGHGMDPVVSFCFLIQ